MRSPDGTVLIDGAEAGVEPLSAGEQAALAALPTDVTQVLRDIGASELEPPAELGYYRRLSLPIFHHQLAHLRGRR